MIKPSIFEGLTDEQILKEIVKYLKVDGALLAYKDGTQFQCFTRWRNKEGKQFVEFSARNIGFTK